MSILLVIIREDYHASRVGAVFDIVEYLEVLSGNKEITSHLALLQ
jgi:hypothetical protein